MRFQEYDQVRIVRMRTPERDYGGSQSVRRPPRVGDVGTIVHFYEVNDPSAPFVVESVDRNGFTIWLADFYPDELERVNTT